MFALMDVIGTFEKALRRSGFRDNGPIMGSQGRLYASGKKKIITIRPVKMSGKLAREIADTGGHVDPDAMREHIGDFFGKLVEELKRVAAEGNVPCELVFQGGGNIPIPLEARMILEGLGFNILFLNFGLREEESLTERKGDVSLKEYYAGLREDVGIFPENRLIRNILRE